MSLVNTKNFGSLSIETCILELVKHSLQRHSSGIAVKFSINNKCIRIFDNGIGLSKEKLLNFLNKDISFNNKEVIDFYFKIINLSNSVILTSKKDEFSKTYVKVFSKKKSKFFAGYQKPNTGTTIVLNKFHPSIWNNKKDLECSISFLLSIVTQNYPKVSFLLQNEDSKKTILDIRYKQNPMDIVKYLKLNQSLNKKSARNIDETKYNDESSLSDSDLNNNAASNKNNCEIKNINDYKLENLIVNQKKASSFCSNNVLSHPENFVLSSLSNWSDWDSNNVKKNEISYSSPVLSEWSNWSYNPIKKENEIKMPDFNEIKKYSMLIDPKTLNNKVEINTDWFTRKSFEYRITENTIRNLEILNQVNKEFIVAITHEAAQKILIIIDQHAIHERIRYESLIEEYREKKSGKYFSVKLDKDLVIRNLDKYTLNLLKENKSALHKVGIHLNYVKNESSCAVDAVPICFSKRFKAKRGKQDNIERLTKNVKDLLQEVASGLSERILPPVLPITLNNVIASEACHEAIKFGDPLTIEDCKLLIEALKFTRAPIRCAHGRPSIIPLYVLNAEINKIKIKKKKLNFAFLKQLTSRIDKGGQIK